MARKKQVEEVKTKKSAKPDEINSVRGTFSGTQKRCCKKI